MLFQSPRRAKLYFLSNDNVEVVLVIFFFYINFFKKKIYHFSKIKEPDHE